MSLPPRHCHRARAGDDSTNGTSVSRINTAPASSQPESKATPFASSVLWQQPADTKFISRAEPRPEGARAELDSISQAQGGSWQGFAFTHVYGCFMRDPTVTLF